VATFVLVHGAWHGEWCWERVGPILAQRGRSTWAQADAIRLFYNDSSPADAADAVSRLRPDATAIYGQVMPELPERRVPTTYISCLQDHGRAGRPARGSR
jgi:hypothetical protein